MIWHLHDEAHGDLFLELKPLEASSLQSKVEEAPDPGRSGAGERLAWAHVELTKFRLTGTFMMNLLEMMALWTLFDS